MLLTWYGHNLHDILGIYMIYTMVFVICPSKDYLTSFPENQQNLPESLQKAWFRGLVELNFYNSAHPIQIWPHQGQGVIWGVSNSQGSVRGSLVTPSLPDGMWQNKAGHFFQSHLTMEATWARRSWLSPWTWYQTLFLNTCRHGSGRDLPNPFFLWWKGCFCNRSYRLHGQGRQALIYKEII